ncbi:MAG: hypothetical protein QNJ97_01685 [Myxococcota bacterium]|nr:hypothetical protein [Myxococcota bacterium]
MASVYITSWEIYPTPQDPLILAATSERIDKEALSAPAAPLSTADPIAIPGYAPTPPAGQALIIPPITPSFTASVTSHNASF